MNAPSTPSQRDGGVNAIILRLNQSWRLSLPIRDYNLSPSRAEAQAQTDVEKLAEKCFGRINFLFWKDRAALERVITNFEAVALRDTSVGGWLYKPNQEPGTLPRTSSSEPSRDNFLARNDISRSAGTSLMQKLLRFLESEAEPALARLTTSPRPGPSSQPLPTVTQPTPAVTNVLEPNVQARPREPTAQSNIAFGVGPAGLSNRPPVDSGSSSSANDHPAPPRATNYGHTVLYPQLEAVVPVPSIERDAPASIQSHEQVHSDDYGSTPDFQSILQDTDTSSSQGAANVDMLMEDAPPLMSEKRAGKQPVRRLEDDSDEEVYFTSQESPPSPSTDREARRQAKIRREATKRSTIKKTEEWVTVIVSPPVFSRQGHQMSKNSRVSRKRSSLDYAASTRRKSSRPSVDEAPPVRVQVKVNNRQVQDNLPLDSRTQHPPPVPLFPPVTSANSSFSTNPNTSFGASPFSVGGGGTTANTSFNSNFDDTFDSPQANSSSYKDAARTRVEADSLEFFDEEEILRENDLSNIDAKSPVRVAQTAADSPQLSQPLKNMGITSPIKPMLQPRLNAGHFQGATEVRAILIDSGNAAIDQYLAESLFRNGPFSQRMPLGLTRCHLRTRYEIYRISLHCDVPMSHIATIWPSDKYTYAELWSWFQRTPQLRGKALPERSSEKAWENAGKDFTNVVLSGELLFNEKREGPLFSFRLSPLKVDLSCRLFRRFGSDRFLALTFPSLADFRLPGHIQGHAEVLSERVINWLVKGNHEILGRTWRAFYVKDGPKVKKQPNPDAKKKDQPFGKSVVYFFAVDGVDFCDGNKPPTKGEEVGRHSRMSLQEMLEWFIPFEHNKEQTCCKVFSRLALALSKTHSSIVFLPEEIRRIPDTHSDTSSRASVKPVMNDGCARISRPAARAIAGILGIEGNVPSCFQGRICGAKGLWMVSTFEEDLMIDGRGFWIEITDSQLKFESTAIPEYLKDEDRVTFEVHSWSKPLNNASLNFQLLPILEGQGVPREVIAKHLEDDLDLLIAEQLESMEDPLALMQWNYDLNDPVEERVRNSGVQFTGGLPVSSAEQMNFLLESGFLPKSCWFLRDLAWRAVKSHCDRLKEKLNISVGRSCYAYCIPDPWGVLKEDEVHLGFSNTFKDGKLFEETELHDVDVLVARLPAALPSDVQKVRAVYKIELRSLKDVIVFSVKGETPLAEKLSGGDYDGDKPWICWDPDIVRSFSNAPLPRIKPSLEEFGVTQDKAKWKDLSSNPDERATEFVLRGFRHSLEKNLLGECTTYHAKLCYRDQTVKTPGAIQLGMLLGLLVDRAKQGYTFTQESWERFQKRICPGNRPSVPAYIKKDASLATNHIIDYLVFQIANPKITSALENFWKELGDVVWWDAELNKLLLPEREQAKRDEAVRQVLKSMSEDIEKVFKFWNENVGEDSRTVEFSEFIRQTRAMFEAILPANVDHPIINRWRSEASQSEFSNWRLLRASAAYSRYYKKKFVWWVAGRELGHMKAMNCKRGYHMVVTPIHAFLKPNSRYLRLMKRKGVYGTNFAAETEYEADEEEEETDFGSSIFGYEDWCPEAL